MPDPIAELVLVIAARDGQYRLRSSPGLDDMWPPTTDGLFVGEDNWIAILCATHWGPVEITAHEHSAAPKPATTTTATTASSATAMVATEWDMIAERSLNCSEAMIIISQLYAGDDTTLTVRPGWIRLRLYVRGRAQATQAPEQQPEPLEHHLLEYWPEGSRRDPTVILGPDQHAATNI